MKAFISHSSNDKTLVKQVAKELGEMRCEYDEYSFEFTLNNSAIRKALGRSDLFVLIVSENSVRSNFVNEEIRSAFEARAAGRIQAVLLISIDATTYKALPSWLQEINVAQHLKSAKHISRRIDALLTELSLAKRGN